MTFPCPEEILMPEEMPMPEELYRIQGLCFQKDHSCLIDHLDLYQYKGESLGLMGLHDSGKTLLSLILSGQAAPSEGKFYYEENPASHRILSASTALVQKNSSLIPSLTVMENIFVIRRHKYGTYLVHRKLILHETLNWMRELGLSISPQEKVCNLTKTEQYLVEILKAYILGAKLIILDDIPLSFFQAPQFSGMFQYLKAKSISFLITSCDINQLQLFSDRIYFMADHRTIKWIYNEKRNTVDISTLYSRPIIYRETSSQASGEISLRVDGLCHDSLYNISFHLHEGEIVTIFDLFRNVSSQLLDSMFHPQKTASGSISVYGQIIKNEGCHSLIKAGFELDDCIFEPLPTRDNICISSYRKAAGPLGILKQARMQYMEQAFLAEYETEGIKARSSCRHLPKKEKLAMYLYRYEFLRKKIIFCVNPEKYIDYETFYVLKNALQRIVNNGNTVCIITCDFEKVYALAGRHLILSSDSIQEYTKNG